MAHPDLIWTFPICTLDIKSNIKKSITLYRLMYSMEKKLKYLHGIVMNIILGLKDIL